MTEIESTDGSPEFDSDPSELDLTPRTPGRGPAAVGSSRSIRNIAVVTVLVAVLGFVLYQALTSARVFFYNVDEAVEQRSELEDRTFRMQGTVVSDEGLDETGALLFTIAFGDETAEVRHTGDEPSGLFEIAQKVVVEGRWEDDVFHSHQILVKHSEEYVEDNPERLEYDVDTAVE